ncbi:hypothetical protein [Winogradskyella sp. 4-2091]|uniref:hypothetical protein n=1 Tax=Winogradskyella sp. 4-2091 TaxID=3381659 RepID=UPI00389182AF
MKQNSSSIFDKLKKRNYKRFGLFFIAAFVLLLFSKLSNDYKQTIKLKVKLINVEDEIIIENDSSNYVDAYVEAKGFSLIPLIFNESKELIVNSNNNVVLKGNQYIFDVQKHKFLIEGQLGNSYNLLSVIPDTLRIPFSKRASKMVPIKLIENINYAVGYDLKGDFLFSQDSIKVVGSSTEVDSITAIFTDKLVLDNVNSKINTTIKLNIDQLRNVEIYPKALLVTGEVARFTEGTKEVPITVTNQPNDITINYFPKTVSVSYYVDLEDYNNIKTEDFSVECDFAEIDNNQNYLLPKVVKKPLSVKRVNIKQKRIDYIKL